MQQTNLTDHEFLPTQQEATTFTQYIVFLLKVLIVVTIFLLFCKRKKRDLKKQQIKVSVSIPINKVIIAIEIKDLFVIVQNKLKPGFQPLEMPVTQTGLVWKTFEKILGYKPCFKPFYSSREILAFVKGLKNVQRIELMLYTSLSPQIADAVLRKLKLSEFFPPKNRKFCDSKQDDMMKHAIDVDKQSRRVVIVTPTKKDHNWQDQKYFLIQNPKGGRYKNLLKDCLRNIKNLVEENESLDTLHDELAQLKIDVEESDMSDFSDLEREMN